MVEDIRSKELRLAWSEAGRGNIMQLTISRSDAIHFTTLTLLTFLVLCKLLLQTVSLLTSDIILHWHLLTIFLCYSYGVADPSGRRGLRRGSAAARLMGLRVRIPPGAWMSVSFECCVLSGRGLGVGLVNRPQEFYRVWSYLVWSWSLDKEEALVH